MLQHYIRHIIIVIFSVAFTSTINAKVSVGNTAISYDRLQQMLVDEKYEDLINLLPEYIKTTSQSQKGIALSDLALCYTKVGRYSQAEECYLQAIRLTRSSVIKDKIRANFSSYLLDIGSYEKATDILYDITTPSMLPHKLINEANARYSISRRNKDICIALLDSCLRIKDLNNDIRFYTLQNKAFILYDMRLYKEATNCFTNLLPLSPDSISHYRLLGNLALSQAKCGNLISALSNIEKAIKYFPLNSNDYLICLRKKAEILFAGKKFSGALKSFRRFFDVERHWLFDNMQSLSYNERLNLWLKEKPLLSKCFLLEDYAPEFLYEVAMFRRQTSLLGMHDTDNLLSQLTSKPNDVRKSLGNNEVAIEFISYTTLDGNLTYAAIILPKNGNAKFVKLFDEDFIYQPEVVGANSLINAIKRDDPFEKNLLYTDTVLADKIWSPIVAALPNSTSKIYFAPEGVFHFFGIENMPFMGKDRFELHRVSSTAAIPYANQVSPHSGRTLLVGGLNYSTLPQDSVADTFNHEAADLLRQKAGNTDFFQYLPGTRSEVDSINAILINADITYNIGEGNLKQEMPKFDIIHIATHGYSLNLGIRKRPEFMTDSLAYDVSLNATGLALSGANIASQYPNREDGLLSAREICDLDLSNVDFVILSACQTALGDITDEGAAGLVRGLKNAGVKTILATLWSVDDKSTMLFMQEFYRLLYSGKTKHDAYLGAQDFLKKYEHSVPTWKFSPRTLSKEREPQYITTKYDAPYYWAPFIIIDDF